MLVLDPVFAAAVPSVFMARTADQMVAIPVWLEMLAVIVASAGGALTAREYKLDLVGCIGLGVVTSLGGGLLRDVTLQVGNVYILNQPLALPVAIAAAFITFVAPRLVGGQDRLISILDIFAVGIYAATGADKAMIYGFEPTVCIMMGFFTAVGGGLLRDVCLGNVPTIFQRSNFYAVAAIAGASSYIILVRFAHLASIAALIVCVCVTMALRFLSIRYDIQSPTEVNLARIMPAPRRIRHVAHKVFRRGRTPDTLVERRHRIQRDIQIRRRAARIKKQARKSK